MSRKLCVFLSCVVLAVFIASCKDSAPTDSNTAEPSSNTNTASATEASEISDELPGYDFSGKTFTVISRTIPNSNVNQIVSDGEAAEVIDDAVYRRNLEISERFNVNIEALLYEEQEYEQPFKSSIMAGDNSFQLAVMHIINSGVYATGGLLTDWNKIPNINLEKPWWNQTIIKNMQIGGKLFLAQNDIPTYTVINNNHAMFFNKNLLKEYNIPDIYNTVREGKWTLDLLSQYVKLATKDMDGNGVMDDSDRWGLIASTGSTSAFLPSCSQPIMLTNEEGLPELAINTSRTVTIVEKVYDICISSGNTLLKPIAEEDNLCLLFRDGKSLFYNGFISNCTTLRDMEDEYGIIPLPKFDENQDQYYTQIQGNSDLVGVPVSVPEEDFEFVGTITEALSAESYKTVRPAIYEAALKTKFLRDVDSEEMLDIITKNIQIDFGFVYHNWKGYAFTVWELMDAKSKDFASYYDRKEAEAQKNYSEVINQLISIE